MTLALGIAAFGGGTWLLVESVEGLVNAVRGWALAAGLSGVVLSAVVVGFDLESTAAGVAATLEQLPGTALGTSVGAAIFLLTAGLGIAGFIAPFQVRTPHRMLVSAAAATLMAALLTLDGTLSRADGVVLIGTFVCLIAVVLSAGNAGVEPAALSERPAHLALRLLAALAGLLIGAELLVLGTREIVTELGISETLFGLLIVAAAVSFEEVILEALPAYRGFPELTVGNAVGTVIFLVTGSLGLIALVRPLDVPAMVTDFHVPALILSAVVAFGLLARGRIGRAEGAILVCGYALYVVLAIVAA